MEIIILPISMVLVVFLLIFKAKKWNLIAKNGYLEAIENFFLFLRNEKYSWRLFEDGKGVFCGNLSWVLYPLNYNEKLIYIWSR